ncbi:MAG: hypothetical protein DRJ50_00750 [Actinobacteria bacterium]|nr:MAG: hypothetical protein DRJ50_00750 [Actinomycetota bacterium]
METSLENLRRLTQEVAPLDIELPAPDMVWPLEGGGSAHAYRIWKEDRFAVILSVVDSGQPFARHIHAQVETITVLAGRLGVKMHHTGDMDEALAGPENVDVVLGLGDSLKVTPGRPHSVYAMDGEECVALATTIPAAEGF